MRCEATPSNPDISSRTREEFEPSLTNPKFFLGFIRILVVLFLFLDLLFRVDKIPYYEPRSSLNRLIE